MLSATSAARISGMVRQAAVAVRAASEIVTGEDAAYLTIGIIRYITLVIRLQVLSGQKRDCHRANTATVDDVVRNRMTD